MSNVSLTANLLTDKVSPGAAAQSFTYRIQEPSAQMCPVWNGQDLAGRPVCEYSFNTKRAGCNSSLDRITVENFLRPKYTNYVTTNAAGIAGYNGQENFASGDNLSRDNESIAMSSRSMAQARTGKFGLTSSEQIKPSSIHRTIAAISGELTPDAMARHAQNGRTNQNTYISYNSQKRFDYGMNGPQYIIPGKPTTYSVDPDLTYQALAPRGRSYVEAKSIPGCGDKRYC
jgi:PPE-repeat protein